MTTKTIAVDTDKVQAQYDWLCMLQELTEYPEDLDFIEGLIELLEKLK